MALSVKGLTLGFSSDHDPGAVGRGTALGSTLSVEAAWDRFSLLHSLALSE